MNLACCPFVFILKSFPLSLETFEWMFKFKIWFTDCREKLLICVPSSTTIPLFPAISFRGSLLNLHIWLSIKESCFYPHSLATCLTHYHISIFLDQDHSFGLKYFFAPWSIFEKFEKIFDNIPIGQKPLIWPTVQWQAARGIMPPVGQLRVTFLKKCEV